MLKRSDPVSDTDLGNMVCGYFGSGWSFYESFRIQPGQKAGDPIGSGSTTLLPCQFSNAFQDHSEDFEDNPTRDTLTEGLMCLLKPSLDSLDSQVRILVLLQRGRSERVCICEKETLVKKSTRCSNRCRTSMSTKNYVTQLTSHAGEQKIVDQHDKVIACAILIDKCLKTRIVEISTNPSLHKGKKDWFLLPCDFF